jgi:hypothetical protein
VEETDEIYRVNNFLPEGGPTVMFGDGGSNKTYQALGLGICVALGRPYLGMETLQGRVMVIDAESNPQRLRNRVRRIMEGWELEYKEGLIHHWPGKGRSLPDMASAIRERCRKLGIALIILDSVALLCSGEPEKADVARSYFNALSYIGCTSLSIAHVTKSAAEVIDQKKPFGSNFWHTTPRMTWNVTGYQEEGSGELDVRLANRKQNDGPLERPVGVHVEFEGKTGPVTITRKDVFDMPGLAKGLSLPSRILHELAEMKTAQTVNVLTARLYPDADPDAIKKRRSEVRSRLHDLSKATKRAPAKVRQFPDPVSPDGVAWGLAAVVEHAS